ncbi:MAG: DNA gyrase inhibitor YacG [Dongiaceae bacterium]
MSRKDQASGGAGEPARRRRGCPTCGAAAIDKYRPFCSARCADIDLGRWLKEGYRIATDEEPADDTTPARAEE